jgi:hypothetical protein
MEHMRSTAKSPIYLTFVRASDAAEIGALKMLDGRLTLVINRSLAGGKVSRQPAASQAVALGMARGFFEARGLLSPSEDLRAHEGIDVRRAPSHVLPALAQAQGRADASQGAAQDAGAQARADARRRAHEQARAAGAQWRLSLSHQGAWDEFAALTGCGERSLDAARRAYRKAALAAHPDRGGSADKMAHLNGLYEKVEKLLGNQAN